MPVVAAYVDNTAVMYNYVIDIVGAITRGRVHKAPCRTGVQANCQPAVRPDKYMIGVRGIDRDPESCGLVPARAGRAKIEGRRGSCWVRPSITAVRTYVDA
jgi:hypothetical protein